MALGHETRSVNAISVTIIATDFLSWYAEADPKGHSAPTSKTSSRQWIPMETAQ